MGNRVSDLRDSPGTSLFIIGFHIIGVSWFLYFMPTHGGLDHPIGWVIYAGLILWFGFSLFALREVYYGYMGRKSWPKRSATPWFVSHQKLYTGDPPYFLKPKSRGYLGIFLPAIVALLLAPILAILTLGIFLVDKDRMFTLFCILFTGAFFFASSLRAIHQYLKARFLNRIRISVNAPPCPGTSFYISVSHPELHKVERMAVDLIMEEEAFLSEGDQSAWDKHFAATVPVCRLGKKLTRRGNLTSHTRIELPASTLPGFTTSHNKIRWFLLVRLDLKLWEGLEQRYPLPIVPAEANEGEFYAAKKETA